MELGYNEFNLSQIRWDMDVVIWVPYEQDADVLLSELALSGFSWRGGDDLSFTNWCVHEDDTCYHVRNGVVTYGERADFEDDREKILLFQTGKSPDVFEDNAHRSNSSDSINQTVPNNSENVRWTPLGVAVRTDSGWAVYDKEARTITNVGNIANDMLSVVEVPDVDVSVGDLIKLNGEYLFVVDTGESSTEFINPRTGQSVEYTPIQNVFGITIYTKVVSMYDFIRRNNKMKKKDALMMTIAMGGCSGNQSMILPFMMMSGGSNKSAALMCAAMMSQNTSANSNQQAAANPMLNMLPVLMMMDDDDDRPADGNTN